MTITTFLGSQFPSASNVSSILFRKLIWPIWIFKSFLHHQNLLFFLTVGQNNFQNKIPILHGKNLKAFLGLKFSDISNWRCNNLTWLKFLSFTITMFNYPTTCSYNSDFRCPKSVFSLICPYFENLDKPFLTWFPEMSKFSS